MTDRTCELCGKEFAKPFYLRRHQNRKTPCAPILDAVTTTTEHPADSNLSKKQCRFCNRVFSSYASMRRHVRQSCKIAPTAKNGNAGMELLYKHTIAKQQQQIEELKGMVNRVLADKGQIAATTSTAQAGEVAISGNNAQVNNSHNININLFGQETIGHIGAAEIRAILQGCLKTPDLLQAAQEAVTKTALSIWSDPVHPENHTCYLPNKKTEDALVHEQTGWEVQPASVVLPPMAQKSIDVLFDHQPYEDAADYAPLMTELRESEPKLVKSTSKLRPVLVRAKTLLSRGGRVPPKAGDA